MGGTERSRERVFRGTPQPADRYCGRAGRPSATETETPEQRCPQLRRSLIFLTNPRS